MLQLPSELLINSSDIEIHEKIGAGTYGEVWGAKWGKELVAVKKISIQLKPEVENQFNDELRALLLTPHPCVLRYYGVCVVSVTEYWLVMELADGSINSVFADKTKFIATKSKWQWSVEMARSVAYLHSHKIIHRALKSFNFLVVKGQLRVSDFGMSVARVYATQKRALSGRWLAPECTGKTPEFTESSDIFALGMVLSELWEGSIPLAAIPYDKVMAAIKYEKKRPILKDTPKELVPLIKQCWDHDMVKRPAISSVLAQLESAQKQQVDDASSTGREYFEINYNDLIAHVRRKDESRIRRLTSPPAHPAGTSPSLPPYIEIVDLYPPPANQPENNGLVSVDYDIRLFNRVQSYFDRFYSASDKSTKVTLDRVEVICNPYLENQYAQENAEFERQFKGMIELRDDNTNRLQLQQEYLENLLLSKNLVFNQKGNPISAWHGARLDKLESICWYGLLNLTSNDPGYFGKGIYLTQKPNYGEYYARDLAKQGKFSLLLCWVLLGRPYAMTKVRLGSLLTPGFSSHYVLVSRKQSTREVCETDEDFENLDGITTYFPVEQGEQAGGDEIVVFRSEQVLPRYIVHYSVTKQDQVANDQPKPAKTTTSAPYDQDTKSRDPK